MYNCTVHCIIEAYIDITCITQMPSTLTHVTSANIELNEYILYLHNNAAVTYQWRIGIHAMKYILYYILYVQAYIHV